MDSLASEQLTEDLAEKLTVQSIDAEELVPSRKPDEVRRTRRATTVTLREHAKTKSRASTKRRKKNSVGCTAPVKAAMGPPLQDTPHPFEASQTTTAYHVESADVDLVSVDGEEEVIGAPKHEPVIDDKPGRRNVKLEEKLDGDDMFDAGSTVDLSSMSINDTDMRLIVARVLWGKRKPCTQLILRDNALTGDGMKILVDELLATSSKLKSLVLSNNSSIGDKGIEHCARLLQASRSLTMIALHYTGITNRGVRILADVLCRPQTEANAPALKKLYISFNQSITDDAMDSFVRILQQNQGLKLLAVQNCGLSYTARRRLRHIAMSRKKKIELSD